MQNKAILLMNLGSPDSTAVSDVRKYLNEFLMDGRVIDQAYWKRFLLVKGIITPFRAPKSAHAYEKIWTYEGSPLVVITKQQKEALQKLTDMPVEIAMRYGNPSPKAAFDKLKAEHPNLEEVIVVSLYPHYAMSSYETAVVQAQEIHAKNNYPFSLNIVPAFYDEAPYIDALAESMRPYIDQPFDHLLFSYHGIPQRHLHKTDPTGNHCFSSSECCNIPSIAHKTCYRHQVFTTTRLVTEKLNIPKEKFSLSFQSRLGKGWLEPFTDVRLQELPGQGIKNLLIVSPAFVSDCLETLEELVMAGRETFMAAGGESYKVIPCMNTQPEWISGLMKIIEKAGKKSAVLAQ